MSERAVRGERGRERHGKRERESGTAIERESRRAAIDNEGEGSQARARSEGTAHGQGPGAKEWRNSARARVRSEETAEQCKGQASERAIGARAGLRNQGAAPRQYVGARKQRTDRGSGRESPHNEGFEAREWCTGKGTARRRGWPRWESSHRLRVRGTGLAPLV